MRLCLSLEDIAILKGGTTKHLVKTGDWPREYLIRGVNQIVLTNREALLPVECVREWVPVSLLRNDTRFQGALKLQLWANPGLILEWQGTVARKRKKIQWSARLVGYCGVYCDALAHGLIGNRRTILSLERLPFWTAVRTRSPSTVVLRELRTLVPHRVFASGRQPSMVPTPARGSPPMVPEVSRASDSANCRQRGLRKRCWHHERQ